MASRIDRVPLLVNVRVSGGIFMNEQKRIDMKVSHQLAEAYWDYLETFHEGAPISRRVLFEEAFSFVLANKIDYRSVMRFSAKRRITPDLPRLTLCFYLPCPIINLQSNLYWAGRKTRVHHLAGKTPAIFYKGEL